MAIASDSSRCFIKQAKLCQCYGYVTQQFALLAKCHVQRWFDFTNTNIAYVFSIIK